MQKFRKKPPVVEAVQVQWQNASEVAEWCGGTITQQQAIPHGGMIVEIDIPNIQGSMVASHFDWVIKDDKGGFCSCKPDIFEATYDAVDAV